MKERLSRLRAEMKEMQLDALLVTEASNRRYLSGFTGTAGTLLVSADEALLITDFRYVEQATEQVSGWEVVNHGGKWKETLHEQVRRLELQRLGFEKERVTFAFYQQLLEAVPHAQWVPAVPLVEKLRQRKDATEVETIRKAAEIADTAFAHVLKLIRPGLKEREVAAELEYKMKQLGASGASFDTIVASGVRSALPHGVASDKVIQSKELITLDFGAYYQGYCSDLTRTIAIDDPGEKAREIYEIVQEAQLVGLREIRAGMTGKEADAVVRNLIQERGYGAAFGHGTGHAIGLDIHESPSLSHQSDGILEAGMVVTVEPGIYLPGVGGVRIEDDVLITEKGLEILTSSPKSWIQL